MTNYEPADPMTLKVLDAACAVLAQRIIASNSADVSAEEAREIAVAIWYTACARDQLSARKPKPAGVSPGMP